MESPITGKPMVLKKENRVLIFRKEEFNVVYHYYLCEESIEQFTDTALDELNMIQVYNQYRDRHNLPFPEEIIALREKYDLSATKMAQVLGFGVNVYRNYENGEVPNESNARLIQLAQNPHRFIELLKLSEVYEGEDLEKQIRKIHRIIEAESKVIANHINLEEYLMGSKLPDVYSGFKKPSLEKLSEIIVFFTERLSPFKTKMNKLLFYADFLHFKKSCFSISGTRYRAIDMGPVPNNFDSIFEYVANNDFIDILREEFPNGTIGEHFKSKKGRKFNNALFTAEELETLEAVAKRFKTTKTKKIIEISHKEKAWKDHFENGKGLIKYMYGFELEQI